MSTEPAAELNSRLRASLVVAVNPDGGWAYQAGKKSRVEPTCWAALALGARPADDGNVGRACALLRSWQRPDGLIAEPGLPPNLAFNGLALLVLDWRRRHAGDAAAAACARLADALSVAAVLRLRGDAAERQDNRLRGWPWTEGAFSWVEPTAWCLLALKRWRRSAGSRPPALDRRISDADAMLIDRACRGGGWNYGNSNMLGQELHAYVPTTAAALLALQDRREEAAVTGGLDFLAANALRETSGMALSLALLALGAYRLRPPGIVESIAGAWERSGFLGNLSATASALCAVEASQDASDAFTL